MFNVVFYKNTSDYKCVNKTLTEIKKIENAVFKDSNNIITPQLLITYDSNIFNSNYCYISDNNRYYYIKDIVKMQGGKLLVDCEVDVLMSNKNEILQLTATVDRNENESNAYLIDENYKALSYKEIVCKSFPQGMTRDSIILMTVG